MASPRALERAPAPPPPQRRAPLQQRGGSAPLVPALEDVQLGYALPLEERPVLGSTVRLFTFPGESTDVARTVVCLPGLGASGRSFALQRPLARSLRLLLWTPPLHTPLTHTPLEWNLRVLESPEAQLPARFALVGSSFGSLVALSFALRHPERVSALVLVSPVATVRRIRRVALSLSTLVRAPMPLTYLFAPLVARALGGLHLPAEGRAEIVREARRISGAEMLRRLKDVLAADLVPQLSGLRVPTLVVHGARDHLVPLEAAQSVQAAIPGARMALLPHASHLPYMSHPQEFNAAVGDFLAEHLPRAALPSDAREAAAAEAPGDPTPAR
ncbi:alpha/beta hydrolase [Aggregicoccus sp. 17bor-14]|uniref:alpha/beta fold hydrolase n=1 Tax=Myxococcaceae TaxID=31 RepID=UPI00129D05C2|nr:MULTISPECIES: alpha/beta hydrolase [Myxococcaceae]MBF5045391.1 alpha/beta hydrolase [Simulacricoccus sp. 17bor-14]MRI91132.1 alpha/beta hydrolase [Aggregicoccus sp. 17bor-14]